MSPERSDGRICVAHETKFTMSEANGKFRRDEILEVIFAITKVTGRLVHHDVSYGRPKAVMMSYISAHIEEIWEKRCTVQSHPGLWFAVIPRDIVGIILDYMPEHPFTGICGAFVKQRTYNRNTAARTQQITLGIAAPDLPALGSGDVHTTERYNGGVLHSYEYPAEEQCEEASHHAYWYHHGLFRTGMYATRHVFADRMSYYWSMETVGATLRRPRRFIRCTYAADCFEYSDNPRTYDEWETLWRRTRDSDTVPLPNWYTGPI